jgi:type III restriction enzyme
MLKNINPRFILDLTATPKAKSNIISFVDAYKLKLENMVKLPVIVYNMVETSDVLASAIRLQERLEERAIAQEQQGGKYIRPIVLFQAQPKTSDDNETFDRIKGNLILMGIPEARIRIKTAEKDEIKNEDLMSKDCPVRYIITVNALKEGWDCPFAYVLASLANKTSRVDVEQILGRVLRLPHTEQHRDPMLNMSYVFTCSANFRNTLETITKGLNNAGFSERDYRLASPLVESQRQEPLSMFDVAAEDLRMTNEEVEINAEEVKEKLNTSSLTSSIEKLEEVAIKQNSDYVKNVKARKESEGVSLPPEIKKTYYKIKDTFSQAKDIKLPQFFVNSKTSDIFGGATQALLLKKENLSEGFDLSLQDKSINFVWTQAQAVQFDLDETSANHSAPVHKYLDPTNLDAFRRLIATMAPEAQKRQLSEYLAERVNSDEIASPHIRKYIKEILDHYTREEITDIIAHKEQALRLIKLKIDGLLQSYRKTKFGEWTDTNKVYMQPSFRFPDKFQLLKPSAGGIRKSLYEKEGEMNDFEYQVINAVANLDNVVFWHRNIEKRGFCINGFINHYPDFIVKLESGMIIIIETKGEQLANDDSAAKLELGTKWANMAGLSFYRYYMVFDHQPISNALTVQQLIDRIKQM